MRIPKFRIFDDVAKWSSKNWNSDRECFEIVSILTFCIIILHYFLTC